MLGNAAAEALSPLLQAGEDGLAAALAQGIPASKAAMASPEATLTAAARAQAEGDVTLARQTLIAAWDRHNDLGARFGDRLADAAISEGDPVSACEALKRALQLNPNSRT